VPPSLGGFFEVTAKKEKIHALESEMAEPGFWSDQTRAREVSQRAADLRKGVEVWETLAKDIGELLEYAELVVSDGEAEELHKQIPIIEKRLDALEFETLFSGAYDDHNAILEIHAGSGGTEANDWSAMLMRMFMRYAEKKHWKVEVLSESRAEEVGYKSVSVRVAGRFAYGHLKSEAGVHRLVRISPFDAESMRHTTFALVDVLPEFEEADEVPLDMNDVRVDTYLASGHGGQGVQTTYSAIRLVHEPTGIMVTCQNERSQQQNKEAALRVLRSKLLQIEIEKKRKELEHIRGDVKSAEWGNQIRSYVLHPYKMVKDHRSGVETQNAEGVLDGDLDAFVEGYLKGQVVSKAKSS